MPNQYEHIHLASNDLLAKNLEEYARRYVGEQRETMLEAARRLRIRKPEQFNNEAFD